MVAIFVHVVWLWFNLQRDKQVLDVKACITCDLNLRVIYFLQGVLNNYIAETLRHLCYPNYKQLHECVKFVHLSIGVITASAINSFALHKKWHKFFFWSRCNNHNNLLFLQFKMAFNSVKLRPINGAERSELRRGIESLKQHWNPFISRHPTQPYFEALARVLAGPYIHQNPPLPPWTKMMWQSESEDCYDMQKRFDFIVCAADLSRLAIFIRTREGQAVREFVKRAFARITLCIDSSIYSLFPGENCLVCYPTPDIYLAQRFGGPHHNEPQSLRDALAMLIRRVTLMAHADA